MQKRLVYPPHWGDDSRRHGERVKNAVAAAGVDFEENETLVRGLDYYN